MLILAVESATSQVGCAISSHDGVLASVQADRARHHCELLAGQISSVCEQAAVKTSDLTAVAVDTGPGLYTGLRVGVTTAVMMAHALELRVVACASLDLLAYALRHRSGVVHAVIDARRGEVFHARYRFTPQGMQRLTEPAVDAPETVASRLGADPTDTLLVGDGALKYRRCFAGLHGVEMADAGFGRPCARVLALMALERVERGELLAPIEVRPCYLRRPDAQANWNSPLP